MALFAQISKQINKNWRKKKEKLKTRTLKALKVTCSSICWLIRIVDENINIKDKIICTKENQNECMKTMGLL